MASLRDDFGKVQEESRNWSQVSRDLKTLSEQLTFERGLSDQRSTTISDAKSKADVCQAEIVLLKKRLEEQTVDRKIVDQIKRDLYELSMDLKRKYVRATPKQSFSPGDVASQPGNYFFIHVIICRGSFLKF